MNPPLPERTPEELDLERMRAKTGLAALIVAIVAVVSLAVVTAILLGGGVNSDSTVAIVTAAFGIISTVVTAYFGIRATANSAEKIASAAVAGSDGGGGGNENGDDPPKPPPPAGGVRQ